VYMFTGSACSSRCEWIIGCHGDVMRLAAEDRRAIIKDVVQPMASDGLRTICIAYKDYVVATPGHNFTAVQVYFHQALPSFLRLYELWAGAHVVCLRNHDTSSFNYNFINRPTLCCRLNSVSE